MKGYELYHFTHADGTAKEWAWCDLGTGQAEIRWGPEGQLRQSQVKPIQQARDRATEKLRKGYQYVGVIYLDDSGTRVSGPPSRPTRKTPVDLTHLLGEGDGFYF
jgi:hypothetical protein